MKKSKERKREKDCNKKSKRKINCNGQIIK